MNKVANLLATASTALIMFSLPASADETKLSPLAGQASASYTTRSSDYTALSEFKTNTIAVQASALYRLDHNLNLQIDYANHEHDGDDVTPFSTWHLGAGIFSRTSDLLLGLTGQTGKTRNETRNFAEHYSFGPTLEVYQSNTTLGATASYSKMDYGAPYVLKSYQGQVYGKFYTSDNVALTLSGNYGNGELQSADWKTYGAFAEAEYAYNNASVFVRTEFTSYETDSIDLDDKQAVVGLRIYLNSDDTNIKSLHRSTTINNTNVMLENSFFSWY
jgi:hypothetical protein